MTVNLHSLDPRGADRAGLVAFLTGNRWPFHVGVLRTADDVAEDIDEGAFDGESTATYWITDGAGARVGVLRLEDLTDPTPMLDLRIAQDSRGCGHGTAALRAATDLVFSTVPHAVRFEGETRADNRAMRRAFLAGGWVQEAHYRDGWPVEGGDPLDAVAYAILRRDWESGTTTPVPWGEPVA